MTESKKRWSWKKRLAVGAGIFLTLFVATAVIVPLVVDVDSYRPHLVKSANEQINGKLEVGRLQLSLWGQVKVTVDGFKLVDAQGKPVVQGKDVFFHMPFWSLLTGSPELTFRMDRPELWVRRYPDGSMNVLTLMKEGASDEQTPAASSAETAKSPPVKIPSVVAGARIGVELRDAQLAYTDPQADLTSKVSDLNLRLKDISPTRPMSLALWADLSTKMGETVEVEGPVRWDGKVVPQLENGEFKQVDVQMTGDFDKLVIRMPGTFEKKSGVRAGVSLSLTATPDRVTVESAIIEFFKAKLTAKAAITGMGDPDGKMSHTFSLKADPIPLAPWGELVPMLKTYRLTGSANLKASSSGAVSDPQYQAEMGMSGVTVTSDLLKAKPNLFVSAKVKTNELESLSFSLRAPGNDLKINGSARDFTRPRFSFRVRSEGMDLDKLVKFPEAKPGAATVAASPSSSSGEGGAAGAQGEFDPDAALDPLRENEIAKNTDGTVDLNLKFVKAMGVKMSALTGKFRLDSLQGILERFQMRVFNGKVAASGTFNLAPKRPTYRFSTSVDQLDIRQAVKSQMELFKNTLLGRADFSMQGQGESFHPERLVGNLRASGKLNVVDARFASIDIGRIATQAINESIKKVADRVPPLRGKSLKPPGTTRTEYKYVRSSFQIANSTFSAPDFEAVAKPKKGFDVKGRTQVNLKDYGLEADWVILDTHDITGAKNLSVSTNGVTVPHVLVEKGKALALPVKVGGTLFEPKVNYTSVPEALANVALKNTAEAAKGKAKAEARKEVNKQLEKVKAPKEVKKVLQGLGKKLFGN